MVELRTRKREMRGHGTYHHQKLGLKRIWGASQFTIGDTARTSPDPACNNTDTSAWCSLVTGSLQECVWEEAECNLRRVNFRRELDPGRAFRPAIRVTGISDTWYRSTMGAAVKNLEGLGLLLNTCGNPKLTVRDAGFLWIFIRRTAGVIWYSPNIHEQ